MGTKADFYIGINKPRWIGSVSVSGDPYEIPCMILIQKNQTSYEELVVDFIANNGGIIESIGGEWPWPWETSQLTDYSYFYSNKLRKVLAYSRDYNLLFEPLKIMQGDDLKVAKSKRLVKFPMMGVGYGSNIT